MQNPALFAACVFGLFFALAPATTALAQNPEQHGWEAVQALKVGATVSIGAYNEDRLTARIVKVDRDFVVVATRHGTRSFAKENIEWLSVKRHGKMSTAGKAIIITAVGAGVGGSIAVVATVQDQGNLKSQPNPLAAAVLGLLEVIGVELASFCLSTPGIAMMVVGRGKTIYWTDGPPSSPPANRLIPAH